MDLQTTPKALQELLANLKIDGIVHLDTSQLTAESKVYNQIQQFLVCNPMKKWSASAGFS